MIDLELHNYIQEIKKYPKLSKEEQKELIIETKKGNEEAFLKLYHSNLRLVIYVLKQNFHKVSFLSYMDLIQEGNLGLMKAIKNFNIESVDSFAFSSFAYKVIHSYILRSIHNYGYSVRISFERMQELKEYDELLNKSNVNLTTDDICNELNMSKRKIKEIENLKKLLRIESLNNLVSTDDEDECIDNIASNVDIENEIITKILCEDLKNKISALLTDKQKEIMNLRYGLEDGEVRGYQEVADLLGYPDRRYVYELEKKALYKIKKYAFNDENKVR